MTAPVGIRILGAGLSRGEADGRYVRRFVTIAGVPTLAGNTRSQLDAAGITETVLENPTGVVQSRIPVGADPEAFLESLDGARFGNKAEVARIGGGPELKMIRAEGSFAAPTPPLSGAVLAVMGARPVTDANGQSSYTAAFEMRARENLGAAAYGSFIRAIAGRVGSGTRDNVLDFQSGGAGIAELVAGQATLRIIPGATTLVIRNNGSTFDAHSFNAAGTSVVLVNSATTGDVSIGSGTGSGNTNLSLRAANALTSQLGYYTGTASRWLVGTDAVNEAGANAGTGYQIRARDDAGTGTISRPFHIVRAAAGAITLGDSTNRQVIIDGAGFGAGVASLRLNGLTNGAGALAGTLNNSPVAGNPAFWLPVSIAGTVRFIPCW